MARRANFSALGGRVSAAGDENDVGLPSEACRFGTVADQGLVVTCGIPGAPGARPGERRRRQATPQAGGRGGDRVQGSADVAKRRQRARLKGRTCATRASRVPDPRPKKRKTRTARSRCGSGPAKCARVDSNHWPHPADCPAAPLATAASRRCAPGTRRNRGSRRWRHPGTGTGSRNTCAGDVSGRPRSYRTAPRPPRCGARTRTC
jgi:hypothetical protein